MRKVLFVCYSTILLCVLTGCWSSRELTDLALTTALGIDYEDDQFIITAQVINPGEVAGKTLTSRTATSVYTAKGDTMFEAIRKLTTVAPRKLYFAHIRVVVFSEEFARVGIGSSLDFVSRDHEMRTDFLFAIAKGQKASDVLKILTPLEKISANKIYTSMEAAEQSWAPTRVVQLDELITSITAKGNNAVLTGIQVIGDPEAGTTLSNVERAQNNAIIETNTLGVFNSDTLVGWMNNEESKGFNFITNNITNTVEWVDCDNGKITFEIMKANTKSDTSLVGGVPIARINTDMEVNIADVDCSIDITNQKTIKTLEKKLNEKTKQIMQASIEKAQEYRSDIFGFGETLQKKNYKQWKRVEKRWNDLFQNKLEIQVNVKSQIRLTGTTIEPFYQMIEDKKNEEG
ncbi:Ger(x)C family spore germination protein [Salirhabdus sp. Marseille-P4669]|uniref:Ger(x)C family spore germination protein n=1 Tax=Salirhabdus sp. Marseille-P4669 TaxID=2042310 RepID=UPI000C7A43FC|nr:Ger(x)C family spore germination protein [Salirhabdus sp. Marseille-P4669]